MINYPLQQALSQNSKVCIWAALILITILASALRLYRLDYQSLWFDELHSVVSSAPENSVQSIIEYCKSDQPPSYFLFIHYLFKLISYEAQTARLGSALLGILSIPAIFWLAREFGNSQVAIVASLLCSVNYFHIYYSQEARFYSMLFLFSTLSYLYFVRSFKYQKIIDFLAYVFVTIILLYTHYYGIVIFVAQAISFVVLIAYSKSRKFIIYGLLSAVLVGIGYLPWIPTILTDLTIKSFWIKNPTPWFLPDYFYNYFGKDILVTLCLVFLIFIFFKSSWKKQLTSPLIIILLIWIVISYLLPFIKSLIDVPILHIRYTIISLPAWFIILGIGWNAVRNTKIKYAVVVCIVLSSVINLIFIRKHYQKIEKQQFREASALVKQFPLTYPVYSNVAWQYNFYFDSLSQQVNSLDLLRSSAADTLWLLQATFFDPYEGEVELDNLKQEYEVVQLYSFHKTRAAILRRKR